MFFTIPPSFSFGKCHLPLHKGGLRLLFICNEKEIEISFKDERTTDGRPYIVVVNSSHYGKNSVIIRFCGSSRRQAPLKRWLDPPN